MYVLDVMKYDIQIETNKVPPFSILTDDILSFAPSLIDATAPEARENYDAAQRGPGGAWAARVISDARENSQRVTDLFKYGDSGHGVEDSRADQAANEWGRSLLPDPNHFRPAGLPAKY
ncbi:Serum Amyloid A-1 Protein [Manis pentadactyla]|nr:Serum Amyloid A-1 Protein [Manis pentadactyla]